MAGVALLQPQDVLKQQRVSNHQIYTKPMRSRRNSTSTPLPNPNPKNNNNNNRRKRSPQKNGSANFSTSPPAKNRHLVMGQVKILKRGQVLINEDSLNVVKENKLVSEDLMLLSTTDRLGPEPDMVLKDIPTIADFYAGSAFVSSPPPSSLPVPAFFKKNHDATSDLRRLLRLDLS